MRFVNKVLVITGASSGVGRSASLMAAGEGGKVYAFARRKEKLEALAEEAKSLGCKGEIIPVPGDVSKQEDVDRLFEKVKSENDKLDVLIANAGIMDKFEPVTHCEEETFDRIFEVNVKGSFRLFKGAIPLMKDGGSIVATTSIAGVRGGKAGVAYTMSKSAIHGLVRNTAAMYANDKIRCNAVAPGGIATEIMEKLNDVDEKGMEVVMRGPKLDKMVASAEEIAENLLFLASDQASNINGQILVSDGGLTNM
ncbi:SDR family oxidoreductase [Peptoniphilus harei]|uniref:SDR family NAD(P)-dependent oxidoreductase n=1 Tax=Peptoniphilus harei TaxID=54005 RepID=UPI0028FF5931|nr:SDR family oxidoreductase [Peptoniphilus harei]MDU1642875.1 SDR family oxidoreductase [Peptoniphilus harei]